MTNEQVNKISSGLVYDKDRRIYADLIAKDGIGGLELNGPVLVEIKNRILISTLPVILKQVESYLKLNPNYKLLVLYEYSDIHLLKTQNPNIIFKSYSQLKEALNKFNQFSNKSVDSNPLTKKLKDPLTDAALALKNKKVSFILGAGISIDAGGLLWNDLLEKILELNTDLRPIGLSTNDYSIIKKKSGDSLIISARYILSQLREKLGDKLTEELQKILYSKYSTEYKTSPTALKSISKIIKDFDNVESVITFNYDQFIEEALEEEGVKSSTYDGGGVLELGKVPVFHIHGLIARPVDYSKTNLKLQSSENITLSERDYHEKYLEDNDWSNIELQHALRRHVCFFIGHSMTDPNLRRLLDYAKKGQENGKEHFIFLKKDSFLIDELEIKDTKDKVKKNKKENIGKKKYSKLDEMHMRRMEQLYDELGINIIWFDENPNNSNDFSNLPLKIEELYQTALRLREETSKN